MGKPYILASNIHNPMNITDIWLNLPVKDIAIAKAFYTAIGFTPNSEYQGGDHSASFLISPKGIVLMLFAENTFSQFVMGSPADLSTGNEVLLSISAETRAGVDEMAATVLEAGGTVFAPPTEIEGWMYNCGFADPDGHKWNLLYIDMDHMPGR